MNLSPNCDLPSCLHLVDRLQVPHERRLVAVVEEDAYETKLRYTSVTGAFCLRFYTESLHQRSRLSNALRGYPRSTRATEWRRAGLPAVAAPS